jgi:hypothetical protein
MPPKILRSIALAAALLVPLGLLHAFILAETCIAITDILFLAERVRTKNTAWLGQPWLIAALLWWAWLLICSTPHIGLINPGWKLSFLQALVIIRFIVFTAALQTWLLTTPAARRAAWLILALSALWIGIESWQQYLTGRNIFGNHRWPDGALTGPFWKPRAGALYGHLVILALLPAVTSCFAKPGKYRRAAGVLLTAVAVTTSVLIGQRMGTIFTLLGLITAALLIPKLRPAAGISIVFAVLILTATPIISPHTHAKLVDETAKNLTHYSQSPYGELETRATVMGFASPWHGWGYNGFRAFCPEPQFSAGLPILHIPGTQLSLAACNLHPHNFYLQALTDSGFPGLILFTALNIIWLITLFGGLWRKPEPLRAGLFIGVLTYAWPLASTDAFPTLYEPGWLFFILGLGLAFTYIRPNSPTPLDLKHA